MKRNSTYVCSAMKHIRIDLGMKRLVKSNYNHAILRLCSMRYGLMRQGFVIFQENIALLKEFCIN